jgi:hypothetical protein
VSETIVHCDGCTETMCTDKTQCPHLADPCDQCEYDCFDTTFCPRRHRKRRIKVIKDCDECSFGDLKTSILGRQHRYSCRLRDASFHRPTMKALFASCPLRTEQLLIQLKGYEHV